MTTEANSADDRDNIPGDENTNSKEPDFGVLATTTQHHEPYPGSQCGNAETQKHWLEYATTFFALVAALGSISAGIVGYWQWSIAQVALTSVQRAFIDVEGLQFIPGEAQGEQAWDMKAKIINEGAVATKNAVIAESIINWCGPHYLPIRDPEPIDPYSLFNKPFGKYFTPFRIPLGPKQELTDIRGSWEPAGHFKRLRPFTGYREFFIGAIRYTDRLSNITHVTKFCYEIGVSQRGSDAPMTPIAFRCQFWNCTDEECTEEENEFKKLTLEWYDTRSVVTEPISDGRNGRNASSCQ